MADRRIDLDLESRIAVANTLSFLAWVVVLLLVLMLLVRGATERLDVPVLAYVGFAAALIALAIAGQVSGSMRGIAPVAILYAILGLLAHPLVFAIDWSIREDERAVGIALAFVAYFLACRRVKFFHPASTGPQ